jgi:tetratricopeptide (TPR) repeat protein
VVKGNQGVTRGSAFLLGLLAVAASQISRPSGPENVQLLGAICRGEAPLQILGPHKLLLLPGMGNDHMDADTRSLEAQHWFDYGLTLARSFEHADAMLAFQKAQAADPTCSLCVWGEAWARGPTINYPVDAAKISTNLRLAQRARALASPGASERIKGLESALIDRYRDPEHAQAGDHVYAQDLDAMNRDAPEDVELAIFDAEAWLIMENDGDRSGLDHAVEVLRALIPANLHYSGLIHFYIHATEEAGEPELAAPYAKSVATLAPAASHMVHMPSHTEYRLGQYEEAARANVAALEVDREYAEKTAFPTPLGRLMYHFHDIQFGLAAAMMSGDGTLALDFVQRFNRDFPDPAHYDPRAQMTAAMTYAAFGRFAPTSTVLATDDVVPGDPFLQAMRHYARGEAFVRLGRAVEVKAEAAQVSLAASATGVEKPSTTSLVVRIARLDLQGRAEMLEHDPGAAATAFGEAMRIQDEQLTANIDPPRWWYPVRRSLAAALLAQGDAAGAMREASTVLTRWKLDPVALALKAQAEQALGQPGADLDWAAAASGWRGGAAQLQHDLLPL